MTLISALLSILPPITTTVIKYLYLSLKQVRISVPTFEFAVGDRNSLRRDTVAVTSYDAFIAKI